MFRVRCSVVRAPAATTLIALFALLAAPATASSRSVRAGSSYEPRELIVQFKSDVSARERRAVLREEHAKIDEALPLDDTFLVDLRATNVPAADRGFENDPEVDYAEPNYIYSVDVVPNDPDYAIQLWGLNNTGQAVNGVPGTPDADIDAPEAWDLAVGSKDVKVAIADTGVDYDHPDLKDNIWQNPGETGGGKETNGKDDDGNGFVDDFRGWDFAQDDNDPADVYTHGTHVAGTIGAVGNNGIGTTGVAWNVSLIPVKVLGDDGRGNLANIAAGFNYAVDNGAQIVNASLGGSNESQTMQKAIEAAKEKTLFVVAAGNDHKNNDQSDEFPCNYKSPNLVCVAATTASDTLAPFSNFGEKNVDIAAPGTNIYSTLPGGNYGFKSGTSMAAPHVSGAAALINTFQSKITPSQLRQLFDTSLFDKLDSLAGKVATSGRLGLPNAPPQKPKPKPNPNKPEVPTKPPDQPTYPDPTDPNAPSPEIDYLFPVPGTTVIVIGQFDDLDGYLGNVNQSYIKEVIVSLERATGGFCEYLTDVGMLEHDCADPLYVSTDGTNSWSYPLSNTQRAKLKRGRYTVRVRIITTADESLLVSTKKFTLSNHKPKHKKKRKR